MSDSRPVVRTRRERLLEYLRENTDRMIVDASVLIAWILLNWWIFGVLGLPLWGMYLVVFGGVLVYTRLTPPWDRPYRAPDLVDESDDVSQEL